MVYKLKGCERCKFIIKYHIAKNLSIQYNQTMEENAKKRRIFIALNLSKEIKEELAEALVKLSGEADGVHPAPFGQFIKYKKNTLPKRCGVKWVKPDGFHLTLHFLGYLDEPQIEKVMAVMNELAKKFGPINFEAEGIGAFPALTNPRIIFLDCRQTNGNSVYELQTELGKKLEKIGITIDKRRWQAHLTLGRVNPVRNTRKVLNFASRQKDIISNGVKTKLPQSVHSLAKYVKIKNKQFSVDSFELMESHLSPSGAEYEIVTSYKL